jgi:DNA-binding FadR family transcriptional regulator
MFHLVLAGATQNQMLLATVESVCGSAQAGAMCRMKTPLT